MRIYLCPQKNYAVSVIIPLYNTEKYIAECLDSLLIQTFQDFEVIVVDDCSTDESVNIVEDYVSKFNGRLTLTKTEKNSGGGGYIPRNLGLNFARGEYVIFLDSDDFLLGTALETLFTKAKKYDADVVYSSIYYNVVEPNDVYLYRDGLGRKRFREKIEDKMEFTADNTDKIFQEFLTPGSGEGNFRAPWSKFVKRELLIQNKILFPDIVTGGDCVWCINVYAYSKRFLRLPIPLYFYRSYSAESISRKKRTPSEQSFYWASSFVAWLKSLNVLTKKIEILRQNPDLCAQAAILHFNYCLNCCFEARMQLNTIELYEFLNREFVEDSTTAFLFSFIDAQQKELLQAQRRIENLEKELNSRSDFYGISQNV